MYKVIAFVGKSAAGKDSLYREFVSAFPNYNPIISCTTRPPREGEIDGVNYYFLSNEEFFDKIKNNEMLEWTSFNGWYYGSCLTHFKKDTINIGVFDPQGVRTLLDREDVDVFICYLHTSDITRLIRTLKREENLNVKEIIRRYYADEDDFIEYADYIKFKKIFGEKSCWLNNENETKLTDLVKSISIILEECGWA